MGYDRDERRVMSDSDRFWSRWSGLKSRCPNAWFDEVQRDPLLRRVRLMVDLSLVGERHILLGPAEYTAAAGRAGTTRAVHSDLVGEPPLEEGIDIREGGPVQRSLAISMDARLVDPIAILQSGRPISGRAEASLFFPDLNWDERLVWMRGPLSGEVSFGSHTKELLDLSISDPPNRGAQIPPWLLDASRFPRILAESVGLRIPIVIGRATLPAPRVDNSTTGSYDEFLICYGHDVVVETVWVNGAISVSGSQQSVFDELGLPVTIWRFLSVVGVTDDFDEVHVEVRESTAKLSGLDIPEAVRRVLGYGGLLRERISESRFSEASAKIGQFGSSNGGTLPKIAINTPTSAIEYVGQALLADHPYLSLAWDGPGLGLIAIDHRAESVASLSNGVYPVIGRVPGGRYKQNALSDLRTNFVLRWGYDPVTDSWPNFEQRNAKNNALCAMAERLLEEEQTAEEISALSIGDASMAAFVADWLVEHLSRPSLEVEIECYPVAWLIFRLGDKIKWTDVGLFSSVSAIIVHRSWSRGRVALTLRLFPSWKQGGAVQAG